MTRKLVLVISLVLALGALAAGMAIAGGGGDDDQPLTGSTLDKATAAALAHTGGGTVVETEVGDDGSAMAPRFASRTEDRSRSTWTRPSA